jgi:hypothetical protein
MFSMPFSVQLADGSKICALGYEIIGVLLFLYVPLMRQILVSVSVMADLGIIVCSLQHGEFMHGVGQGHAGVGPFYGAVHQKLNGLLAVCLL